MITNPEINLKNGLAFTRNVLIFSFETPIRKITNTTRIGIRTPIENKPRANETLPGENVIV